MTQVGGAAGSFGRKGLRVALGLAAAAAMSLGAAASAQASPTLGNAEKLRRLDIMLMVTSLRCRATAESFSAEYGQFTTSHLAELNRASDQLRADLAQRHGHLGSARALDKISTVMANTYGQGHPWLSCGELKMVARDLAVMRGEAVLLEAADQLLGESSGPEVAYARR